MRVDLIITELDVGGAEKCLVDIAIFLSRQLHQVRIIALGKAPTSDRDALHRRLVDNHIVPIYLNGTGVVSYLSLKRQLRRLAQDKPPQIAMSFLFHANFLASQVYPKLGIPFIAGVRVADRSKWRALLSKLCIVVPSVSYA